MTNAFTSSGLFGALFSDQAIADTFGKAAFCARLLAFEAAWTRALTQTGLVKADDAELALAAINGFDSTNLGAGSDRDGLPVPAMVAQLRRGLPESAARAIHTGATSQDVIDTAMVLTCLDASDILAARLRLLVDRIDLLIQRDGERAMMARTRMQAAIPATAALRLWAWQRPLVDHLARLVVLREGLSKVQIGGAIGLRNAPGGTHQADRISSLVADELRLALGPVWQTNRSLFVDFGHWLVLVAGALGKIGQDVALMAQQGIDEIALSGGGGSSAMAHKSNPVGAEIIVGIARFVGGQQGILAQALVHEQERSGAALAIEWLTLPAMTEATGAALHQALILMASVTRVGLPD